MQRSNGGGRCQGTNPGELAKGLHDKAAHVVSTIPLFDSPVSLCGMRPSTCQWSCLSCVITLSLMCHPVHVRAAGACGHVRVPQ